MFNFSFLRSSADDTEGRTCNQLKPIYSLGCDEKVFIRADLVHIFKKIFTDVIGRTDGIPEEVKPSLWDNCLLSEANKGLVSLLAYAIADKSELFLVYDTGVVRKADDAEIKLIKADYEKKNSSEVGIYVSFKSWELIDLLRLYSAMEYCVLGSFNKVVNVSQAIQVKVKGLRGSVGLVDAQVAIEQGTGIANALRDGDDVLLDGEDELATTTPEIDPTSKSVAFLDAKRAWYLGTSISYINGQQATGISSTGESDNRANEECFKHFFNSVIQPVLQSLYKITVKFKSIDFRQINSNLETLKTLELVSEELISLDEKKEIIRHAFDLKEKAKANA